MPLSRWEAPSTAMAGPLDILDWFAGPQVPDPITFVIGEQWLAREQLYPRQGTMLKMIFLRDDLFTDYDRMVIAEWIRDFEETNPNAGIENKFTAQTKGCQPDIFERIAYLKERGYKWFPEVLLAIGRRGGKGYVSALAMAYVLWHYMATGNPQEHYGIDRDKALACMIFAGKKQQAIENLWGDLYSVITGSACFTPYISDTLAESLTVYAPHDFIRMREQAARGIVSAKDMASFRILPRESTLLAGRGPAGFIIGFDEAAHVKNAGTTRAFGEVYGCLMPTTKVLCADLTWKQIQDVEPGDLLIGVDEESALYQPRKLREAKVLAKWHTRRPSLKLTFDDGTHVICSKTHRWLKVSSSQNYWCQAGLTEEQERARGHHAHLKVGDKIRFWVDPWELDTSREAGYLAGIYDGEGHITTAKTTRCMNVSFTQLPGLVWDKTLALLEERGYQPVIREAWEGRNTKARIAHIPGQAESLRFLGSIRPERLLTHARHLWEGRCLARMEGSRLSKTIVSIEELGELDLIDIQTSTGTFIAEGLVSHNSARPALDQFSPDGFVILPSSTWEMIGKFYELWELALEREVSPHGELAPSYPDKFMLQLESWAPYKDWDQAHVLPLFPPGYRGDLGEYDPEQLPVLQPLKGAIQAFDEAMAREERANPDTFAVERRSNWATAMDAYLNTARVNAMFAPWEGRPEEYGRPELAMQTHGPLIIDYRAHGDPSTVNNRFGFAVAHIEHESPGLMDQQGRPMLAHAVFDLIHFWDPADFDGHIIDYDTIINWIFDNVVMKFQPGELTFDQFNSVATVQFLQKKVRAAPLQKNIQVYERTATAPLNWATYETFKAALNMGLVHAPPHAEAAEELKFLQKPEGLAKVICPDSGPVITKDIADCIAIVTASLLGEQMKAFIATDLANLRPHFGLQGGDDPYKRFDPNGADLNPLAAQLGRGGLSRGLRPAPVSTRGPLGRPSPLPRAGRGGMGRRGHRS